ncbi:unnamed protein product [Ranitomeya imitator]|uniref:V-type proton ATPase subunit C n=1 Tax=Ranitomeya imitator TaxID=111125 RepID=A0ABN9LL73_9NEOB|nr:unnamed protein product [Ranitomeya imitator]
MGKFPYEDFVEIVGEQMSQIDTDLKSRALTYNNIKSNLQSLERKTVGNLLTRTLADIVNKEDFVLNSEYLITLLGGRPKGHWDFLDSYFLSFQEEFSADFTM